jgi:hypothetical protein
MRAPRRLGAPVGGPPVRIQNPTGYENIVAPAATLNGDAD